MSTHRYKVALHRLQISLPETLAATDVIPSFSPFVCEEEGDVLFSMSVAVGVAPDFRGMDEIGQFDCGGANHGVYRDAGGTMALRSACPPATAATSAAACRRRRTSVRAMPC